MCIYQKDKYQKNQNSTRRSEGGRVFILKTIPKNLQKLRNTWTYKSTKLTDHPMQKDFLRNILNSQIDDKEF